jgi:hypothetical protein
MRLTKSIHMEDNLLLLLSLLKCVDIASGCPHINPLNPELNLIC